MSSLILVALAGPSGARAAQVAFGKKLLDVVPFTAAIGVLYTGGSCLAEDMVGSRGYMSTAAGGALAGAVTVGMKHRSGNAALVGALGMGSLCALTQLAIAMEPSVQGIRAGTAAAPVIIPSEQLASSASRAQSYTGRLQ